MGRVKELWQAERDKKFCELIDKYRELGCNQKEAERAAINEMEEEDAANGQFGVGA